MSVCIYVVKSYSWSQNHITVRFGRVRARVSAVVKFRLIISVGQCQIYHMFIHTTNAQDVADL